MKIEWFTDIQLEVGDPERSARWYRRMLGMKASPHATDEGRELHSASGLRLRVVLGTAQRSRQFRLGVHVAGRVEVRRWRSHIDANGGLANPITDTPDRYGFTIADPDGYLLEFYTETPEE